MRCNMFGKWLFGSGIVALALMQGVATAVDWPSKPVTHVANEETLDELLRTFAADQGVSIVVSKAVTGRVSGRFGPLPPLKFLDQVTRSNGLIWYDDGNTVYVYRSDEITTKLYKLQRITPDLVLSTLKQLDLYDGRFRIKALDDAAVIFVSGPARFVEVVGQTVEMLEAAAPNEQAELAIAVYPLKYAWAADQTVTLQNKQVVIPGVATILQNLISGQGGQQIQNLGVRNLPRTLEKLKGEGLIATERIDAQQRAQAADEARRAEAGGGPQAQKTANPTSQMAYIQADPRLNAVVVRDVREKLSAYEETIQALDQPVGLVEVTATIIDIRTDSGFEWGMPYFTEWRHNGKQHKFNMDIGAETGTALSTIGSAAGGNLVATLIRDQAREFMINIKALESSGLASIQSKPSVLTMNNLEAILSNQSTQFIKVDGSFEVDLFNASAGTTLKVVPHIINEPNQRKVKLLVDVKDGNFRVPVNSQVVTETFEDTITTQAVLNEYDSLLIGGLFREEDTVSTKAIPYLGRIPKIGFLFRSEETSSVRKERVILITPRIVEIDTLLPPPVTAVSQKQKITSTMEKRLLALDEPTAIAAETPAGDEMSAEEDGGIQQASFVESVDSKISNAGAKRPETRGAQPKSAQSVTRDSDREVKSREAARRQQLEPKPKEKPAQTQRTSILPSGRLWPFNKKKE